MKIQQTGTVRWKIRTKHRHTDDIPFHEWLWTGVDVRADRLGRINARMHEAHWELIRCLYADCPGEALIRVSDVVALLPLPVVVPRPVEEEPEQ